MAVVAAVALAVVGGAAVVAGAAVVGAEAPAGRHTVRPGYSAVPVVALLAASTSLSDTLTFLAMRIQ